MYSYSIDELQQLLTLNIPYPTKQEDSYLDITRQRFRETIISRIYAYYLDANKNTKIANLFLTSLLELIQEKRTIEDFYFQSYHCSTEVQTDDGNRIDLLIRTNKHDKAIIIENKINHELDNDLDDYWNSINSETKIGIVLTLKPTVIEDQYKERYINITHKQWQDRILQKGIPDTLTTNQKLYLTDFINNMQQLSKAIDMNEQTTFFFDNSDIVLKTTETYEETKRFVQNQLTIIASSLGLDFADGNIIYQQLWDGKLKSRVYYTITMENLYNSKHEVSIIIELSHEAKERDKELQRHFADNQYYKNLIQDGRREKHYIHFAYKTYPLTKESFANFAKFVVDTINAEFKPLLEGILAYLNPINSITN